MIEELDRSPWFFDKRLILLKRSNGDVSPSNVYFQHSPFLIQFFNIPIKSMNSNVGTCIAKEIGSPKSSIN